VKQPDPEPLLLNRKQAAKLLGICESHLQRLTKDGTFPVVRLGTAVRYRREMLEAKLRELEGK
jgi:excisionase family DNA binding protein